MTDKQKKIYDIIKKFIEENGYSPTIREIGEIANLNSTSTVYQHLIALENKGYITTKIGKSRTIKVVK